MSAAADELQGVQITCRDVRTGNVLSDGIVWGLHDDFYNAMDDLQKEALKVPEGDVMASRARLMAMHHLAIARSRQEVLDELEAERAKTATLTDDQVKHMVDRFLFWRLPEHFLPDCGISFEPEYNVEHNAQNGHPPSRHEPRGTNLLDAQQAEAMVRHMVEELPPVKTWP